MAKKDNYYRKLKALLQGLNAQEVDEFLIKADRDDFYQYGKFYYEKFIEIISKLETENEKLKNQIK